MKPGRLRELKHALIASLDRRPARDPSASLNAGSWSAAKGQPLTVLVPEDNPVNQQVARRMLEKRGHTVLLAGNGREAFELLDRQPVDLILMDVQMPEMDGFDATAAIRAREKTTGTHCPIVALTAHAMKGDAERCLAVGMDTYVSKPLRAGTGPDAARGSAAVPGCTGYFLTAGAGGFAVAGAWGLAVAGACDWPAGAAARGRS
jgi:CheY-like chemotaxis protein